MCFLNNLKVTFILQCNIKEKKLREHWPVASSKPVYLYREHFERGINIKIKKL